MSQIPSYKNVHNRFKLDGNSFKFNDLFEVAYSFIKEGKPHERIIGDFLMDWINPKEVIAVKTSGSTGAPKFITYSKQAMVNSALATGDHFGITIGSSSLHCLSAEFIAGKMMLVRAMILGLELDLVPPNGNVLEGNNKKYDFVAMVPIQVDHALNQINQVKTLLVGGTAPSSTLINALESKTTNSFITFGMTETLTHIASRSINLKEEAFSILPGVNISRDNRGCLNINVSYLKQELIVTNDLVTLESDTSFRLLGRIDNVINSGGVKLIPEEIEQKISTLISDPFFIGSIRDEKLGQKAILVIEGKKYPTDILSKIEKQNDVNAYQMPKAVAFIESFEYTDNGKLKRKATLSKLEVHPY
ncbi:MAG: AMP-binding protein [Flavobacteriales bacterium]|nr:AMP-binding protein [Flavobacteriaceae bacterium]